MNDVVNVIIAGLGGQGVIKASDVLGQAVFDAGLDVKKSEVHGMSQRGGSVISDIRFGQRVFSPMVPIGEADYLIILEETQIDSNRHRLRQHGVMITPTSIDENKVRNKRSMNVALLGVLSTYLDIPEAIWLNALRTQLDERLYQTNEKAFRMGVMSIKG